MEAGCRLADDFDHIACRGYPADFDLPPALREQAALHGGQRAAPAIERRHLCGERTLNVLKQQLSLDDLDARRRGAPRSHIEAVLIPGHAGVLRAAGCGEQH